MSITKSELMERVASRLPGFSMKEVECGIKSILDEMIEALACQKRIEIRGFGSFSLHYRRPRRGRNPKSGNTVELPGKYVAHFKPGKELREGVTASMLREIAINQKAFDAGSGERVAEGKEG